MEAGSVFTLPAGSAGLNRVLYFYKGDNLSISGKIIKSYHCVEVESDMYIIFKAGNKKIKILVLQGKPI